MSKKIVVMDGNTAAAYVSYAFTEVASIYPITPSSQMAEIVDEWAANGKKNLFGNTVNVIQMQSEAGAAGTAHGSLQSGALTTTYTAAQGLLLMIPPMYKIAGEFLPGVFHVSARTLSVHALSIFGDHSDVMTCRMIGFAMLASANPQEAMDMGAVAHLAAIKAHHPFIHFFDGFRTSHEMQKIDALDYEDLRPLVDYDELQAFRRNALNPEHPSTRGTSANQDIFFQCREGCNEHFDALPGIIQGYMDEINKLTGRNYGLFDYYGDPEATEVIIAMCSVTDTIKDTVDFLNAQGRKVGMIAVHLYRPFSAKHFLGALPETARRVAVLDRTKEPGANGEPLYHDVKDVITGSGREVVVVGGRYGLASKDTTPGQIIAVYDNLLKDEPKNDFTIGIEDDVTFTSLPYSEVNLNHEGVTSCKLWGIGGDGTVGANKNSIKIIGMNTDLYSQAYFAYDAKKSGGLTQSHLRFGDKPIRAPYLVGHADFVAVHDPSYLNKYEIVRDIKPNGVFLLNCPWDEKQLETHIPAAMKRELASKHIKFYTIDATGIAREIGLANRTNTVLQAAFFKLANIIPIDVAVKDMKAGIYKSYFAKAGQKVVDMNCAAVDQGVEKIKIVNVPESWLTAEDVKETEIEMPAFIKEVVVPMNRQEGDAIPLSTFKKFGCFDGTWPNGTTKWEKRAAAVDVVKWNPDACIQCNRCSYICPHAAIRPVLATEEELKNAPESFVTVQAKGAELGKYRFRMQVSPYDCMGCASCVNNCPSKGALEMLPTESQLPEHENWKFGIDTVSLKKDAFSDKTVKSSQFAKPYFEFSAACSGCAETPYIKLVTQLFGDHMYVANASGCSSAYGGALPATPYCTDAKGCGPAWEQSLFEDNAEFAFGYLNGHEAVHEELAIKAGELEESGVAAEAVKEYLENKEDSSKTREVSDKLLDALRECNVAEPKAKENIEYIVKNSEFLTKKSVWAFGGDGWAYDIGFGGLDHVLASGRDINILVMDTEVYSNTGGQSSKSTSTGAIAKFAASGKKVKKKDLGRIAMSYGYIYVAQVAMGYDPAQTLKAIREAEAYPGPSLVICYCPCIIHGIPKGMSNSQNEMKRAVEAGYWQLYRYNPLLKKENKNPFTLDSKAPTADYLEFMRSERRFAALEYSFPERAKELYVKAKADAEERYEAYAKMARGE
ncbi:MAG: pyruvate:ferredoxin (flavodoxin) oxidoreductase [Oscillospiraceae bacterium]|nr:pyruvate:ferredoxin (flavodoxin) oxidoreductase [Oscillospiraceae bacterium]